MEQHRRIIVRVRQFSCEVQHQHRYFNERETLIKMRNVLR